MTEEVKKELYAINYTHVHLPHVDHFEIALCSKESGKDTSCTDFTATIRPEGFLSYCGDLKKLVS